MPKFPIFQLPAVVVSIVNMSITTDAPVMAAITFWGWHLNHV